MWAYNFVRENTEHFSYDAIDRLTNWTINDTAYTANFFGNGNIVRKSDFGMYAYSSSKPHAVSGISSLIAGTGTERTCRAGERARGANGAKWRLQLILEIGRKAFSINFDPN